MEERLIQLIEDFNKGRIKRKEFEASVFQFCNQWGDIVLQNGLRDERRVFIREHFKDMSATLRGIQPNTSEIKESHLTDGDMYILDEGKVMINERRQWAKKKDVPTYDLDYEKWFMDYCYEKSVNAWNRFANEMNKEKRMMEEVQRRAAEQAKKKDESDK